MKAKINAISDEKQLTEADYITILEQESEDEDQEAARKAKDAAERESRIEKRRTGLGVKRPRPTKAEKLAAAAAQAEKDVEEEEESDGEWEAELELPTSQGQVDGRVAQMMAALMNQGDIGRYSSEHLEDVFLINGQDSIWMTTTRAILTFWAGTMTLTIRLHMRIE